jgi:hypothetical protein
MQQGAPPQGFGAPGAGFPPPQQQGWNDPGMGQPGMPPNAGGQMAPYGHQGMAPQGQPMPGAGPIVPGQHGARGQVRSGTTVLLISMVSCGFYQLWWFWQICEEMKAYLQRDEPSFWKIFLFTNLTCGIYAIYWQITRCGALIQEIQQRAGLPQPTNPGIMLLVPYYNIIVLQEELNKAWQSPT